MAMTRADLLRQLPVETYCLDGDHVTARFGGCCFSMEVQELAERKIGMLALPQLQLLFTFTDWQQAEIDAFMRRFERVYQRGGG